MIVDRMKSAKEFNVFKDAELILTAPTRNLVKTISVLVSGLNFEKNQASSKELGFLIRDPS